MGEDISWTGRSEGIGVALRRSHEQARGNSRWDRQEVDVPVKERGVYLVEAVNKDLRAYTPLMVSDLVMLSKVAHGAPAIW